VSEPDLTAELDAAEAVVMHGVTTETEWGVRYKSASGEHAANYGSDEEGEKVARMAAADYRKLGGALVRRTVTYGPWEPAENHSAPLADVRED
jgi:hypothetical protein